MLKDGGQRGIQKENLDFSDLYSYVPDDLLADKIKAFALIGYQ